MQPSEGKHILLLLGWFYPDQIGGTEAYVQMLGRELQSKGFKITIAAPSTDEKMRQYDYKGLSVHRYPVAVNPTRAEVRGKIESKYLDIFKDLVSELNPDITHMHSYITGCGISQAQVIKQLGIPLILTVHMPSAICPRGTGMRWGMIPCDHAMNIYRCTACCIEYHLISVRRFVSWISAKIHDSASNIKKLFGSRRGERRRLFDFADHVVAISRWLYDALLVNGVPDSKLSLCRGGLPPRGLVKTKRSFDFGFSRPIRIGYVGRFDITKGVHVLIKAVKMLRPDLPVEARIYGVANSKKEKEYLEKLRRISGNDSRIIFCGEMTEKDRQKIYDSFDILAVPSIWMEAGPLVILEAFATSLPVMGSDLGGIAEFVTSGTNGILIKPGNARAWAETIEKVSKYPLIVKAWAESIPEVRDAKAVAIDMINIYESILK